MGWAFGTSNYKDKVEINVGEEVSFSIWVYDSSTHHFRVVKSINSQSEELYSDKTVSGHSSYSFQHTFNEVGVYTVSCSEIGTQGAMGVTVTVIGSVTHDYAIEFDESSYSTCNGSCTVSATLTDNNNPVSGETVTLTGTGSTLTATTDSNGVATFNLTGINENKTLTVSFDEVSDTASLTYGLATLNGSLTCLGKRMASNLTSKGITGVDYTDGLTSLADEILNIQTLDNYEEVELAITYTDTSTETITVLKEKTTP